MAIAITVAPFCAVQVAGLGDTLNHLARMHILLNIDRSPDLQRFYVVTWSPVPYLAMDAVVPLLARLMPIYMAAKFFVVACVLMPFVGAASLRYAVRGRLGLVPAVALLLGANMLMALGFLNYVFMAGLAVMVFAAWIATANWPRLVRWALFTPLATLLYLGHAFAFFGYGCAVAGHEIWAALHGRSKTRGAAALDWLAAGAQALPAFFLAGTLNTAAGAPGRLYSHYGDAGEKLLALVSPFLFLIDPVQLLILGACSALAISLARRFRVHAEIWPAMVVVGAAALATPEILLSTWLTDFRLPLFVLMLLLGGLQLRLAPRWRGVLAAALLAVLAAKSLDTWCALRLMDGQIAQMRQVLSALPRGARLLVANESAAPMGQPALSGSTIWTMPLLAVIDRDAFVPTLFTGLTTVHMRPEFAASSTPQGSPVPMAYLLDDLAGRPALLSAVEQREELRPYWHNWPAHFDYLLIEHFFAPAPKALPKNLSLVRESADIGLYRITK